MGDYTATIEWRLKDGDDFLKGRYSRAHTVAFDGGITVAASASPSVVPKPWSADEAVDPEEFLVAALSNCHMLTFLDLARRAGIVVASYRDEPVGTLGKTSLGRSAVTHVTLRPQITYVGATPDPAKLAQLHRFAHEGCFIANSVKTEVAIEPR